MTCTIRISYYLLAVDIARHCDAVDLTKLLRYSASGATRGGFANVDVRADPAVHHHTVDSILPDWHWTDANRRLAMERLANQIDPPCSLVMKERLQEFGPTDGINCIGARQAYPRRSDHSCH